MNKNAAKINAGIRALSHKPNEITSGTVVSVDAGAYTMVVQPSDDGEPIENVRLNAISGYGEGWVVIPKADSHVVISSIDGPGEWTLIRASEITKATIKIGTVTYTMDDTKITLQNSNVLVDISDSVVKINTASESLFALLQDLITSISAITVPTPAGASGVPANAADFTLLLSRLSNLLSS